jgi:hypothetical protein
MGNRRKAEIDSYEVGIEDFLRWHSSGVKSTDFPGHSVLSRTEFQQPDQLQKFITPKPFIVSRRENNC